MQITMLLLHNNVYYSEKKNEYIQIIFFKIDHKPDHIKRQRITCNEETK